LLGGWLFYSERMRSHAFVRWILSKLPFRSLFSQISSAVYVYKFHPREVLLAILISFGVHILVVITNILVAFALIPGPFSWLSFFFLVPLAQVAMAIPINPPGALGTGELLYAFLLGFAGIPDAGAKVCILQRITNYAWALVGCAIYLRRKRKVIQADKDVHAPGVERSGEEGPRPTETLLAEKKADSFA
ncbi:MAG TPA: hypothetical protein VMT52_06685, partial [Planctomycetota bacterium]|nr:hypothetical protein [Planctomycetota bacterium]